jgi:tetratricopeptide (TPR) repeat protein
MFFRFIYDKKKTYLILAGLCFLVYANSLKGAFVSDDITAIINNPKITNPAHYLFEPSDFLSSLTYLLLKDNPLAYHLTNVILHSINTILVFIFLSLFFKTETSLLGASIFAVHPIHAEAVSWISGRVYLVAALFIFSIYFSYLRATQTQKSQIKTGILYYLFSLLLFSYFMVKHFPFGSLIPFFLILSDVTFAKWRKNWKLWLPFLGILALRLSLAKNLLFERIDSVARDTGSAITWANPVFNLAYSFFSHLGLLIWPAKLTLYHEPAVISPLGLTLELLALSALVLTLPLSYRKAKPIFFALGIFVIYLAPTYSPVLISWLVAERYAYIPCVALSICLCWAYEKYIKKSKTRRNKALVFFIVIITVYSMRTVMRNEDWKTPERLWESTLKVSPLSPRAHNNMGDVYSRTGNMEAAMLEFRKAIELNPNYADAYHNLANTYYSQGNLGQAILYYQKAVASNPGLFESHYNLGIAYINIGDFDKATEELTKAAQLRPDDKNVRFALEFCLKKKGIR